VTGTEKVLKTLVHSLFRHLTQLQAQERFAELSHPVKFRLCMNMILHMPSTNTETPGCNWTPVNESYPSYDQITAGC